MFRTCKLVLLAACNPTGKISEHTEKNDFFTQRQPTDGVHVQLGARVLNCALCPFPSPSLLQCCAVLLRNAACKRTEEVRITL
jgi:hypothetical protein